MRKSDSIVSRTLGISLEVFCKSLMSTLPFGNFQVFLVNKGRLGN